MKLKNIILTAFSVLGLASCVTNEELPVQALPQALFESKGGADATVEIARKGETKLVGLKATCDWTISCESGWVKVSPMSGTSATKDVTITVDTPNEADDDRIAKVIIFDANSVANDTLLVLQKGSAGEFNGSIKTADAFFQFLSQANSLVESDVVELMADVDLGGATINPVDKFYAVFNGNGHAIYNFNVASDRAYAGIFFQNYGEIKDLIIGSADGKSYDGKSKICFASSDIVGIAAGVVAENNGIVKNVKNFAAVDFNTINSDADASVGGVVGQIGMATAVISGCENHGAVTYTGEQGYRACMGGVLGLNASGQTGALIENCINTAAVVKATVNQKEFAMGGVVGRANAQLFIKDCVNEGVVSYESTDKPGSYIHIAGIIGAAYYDTQISDCKNKGAVSSVILQVNRIAGIAGTMNTGGLLENCVNDGEISVIQGVNANWQGAGGICGLEEKASASQPLVFRNCTNNGAIILDLNNTTTHANEVSAGGIIGISCSVVEYTGNVNNGKIFSKNAGGSSVHNGGIIGSYIKGSGLQSSGNINKGSVGFEASKGTAGGIIGYVPIASSSIKEETNRGAIAGSVATNIGAIAGVTAASLNSCAVAGTVGGVEVTNANLAALIQGSASTGAPVACYVEGAAPADYLAVAPASVTFAAAGEEKTVTVSSNCGWTVSSSAAWLTLSAAEGEGEATVTLTAAENTSKDERSAVVTFTSKNDAALTSVVNVKQNPKPEAIPGNQIKTAEHLKSFLNMASEIEAGETFTIENDIDYTAETLVPAASFAGTLDGKGHKITLKAELNVQNAALISNLSGTVKNVVTAGSVKSVYAEANEHTLAALVAICTAGTVENCVNEAEITATVNATSSYCEVAGVVAVIMNDGAAVKNCKNTGKISMLNGAPSIVGGVVAYGKTATGVTLSVTDCEATGDILFDQSASNWNYVGGVLGKMGASKNGFKMFTIKNCSYSGKIIIKKSAKIRGGGVYGSGGVADNFEVSGLKFTGEIDIQSTEAVDRLFGGVGPGFSETAAIGTISNCVFDGSIKVVDKGNLYIGGIYGTSAAKAIVIDNCKTTAKSSISGFTQCKSVGVIAGRCTGAGFTVKNCKIAGKVTSAAGEEITINAENIADWMFQGSATAANIVTLENNGFNAE